MVHPDGSTVDTSSKKTRTKHDAKVESFKILCNIQNTMEAIEDLIRSISNIINSDISSDEFIRATKKVNRVIISLLKETGVVSKGINSVIECSGGIIFCRTILSFPFKTIKNVT